MKTLIKIHLTLFFILAGTSACAAATEVPVNDVPAPQDPVSPTEIPLPAVGGGADVAPAPLQVEMNIPNSAQVAPADILDQVVFQGVGGGEHVCRDMNELCAESRYTGGYFVGFQPGQKVIIILYQYIQKEIRYIYFTRWESTIGADGTLLVQIPNLDFFPEFVVLDASTKTFLVASAPLMPDFEEYYSGSYSPCTNASYQSRLRIGDKVRVAYVNGTNLRIRRTPDHSSRDNIVGGIPEGTVLYLDSAPQCAGDWVWWQITYKNVVGWVAEGDGTDWLLEPWK